MSSIPKAALPSNTIQLIYFERMWRISHSSSSSSDISPNPCGSWSCNYWIAHTCAELTACQALSPFCILAQKIPTTSQWHTYYYHPSFAIKQQHQHIHTVTEQLSNSPNVIQPVRDRTRIHAQETGLQNLCSEPLHCATSKQLTISASILGPQKIAAHLGTSFFFFFF